jgi:hypothetical protein
LGPRDGHGFRKFLRHHINDEFLRRENVAGAAFDFPSALADVISAIGRGTIVPVARFYSALLLQALLYRTVPSFVFSAIPGPEVSTVGQAVKYFPLSFAIRHITRTIFVYVFTTFV